MNGFGGDDDGRLRGLPPVAETITREATEFSPSVGPWVAMGLVTTAIAAGLAATGAVASVATAVAFTCALGCFAIAFAHSGAGRRALDHGAKAKISPVEVMAFFCSIVLIPIGVATGSTALAGVGGFFALVILIRIARGSRPRVEPPPAIPIQGLSDFPVASSRV